MQHLKIKRDLNYFITGSIKKKKYAEIIEHINTCKACSDEYKLIQKILKSHNNKNINPSNTVKRRIIQTYNDLKNEKETQVFNLRSYIERLRSIKPAYAIAMAIVLITLSVITIHYIYTYRAIPINISYTKGKVFINNKTAGAKSRVRNRDYLSVGKDSMAVLSLNNIFSMMIDGESNIRIEKIIPEDKNKRIELLFKIKKGKLISKSNDKNNAIGYSYITPNAQINTKESEIIINANDEKTTLVLKSGSAKIMSLESNEEIECSPDKKYIISSDDDSISIIEDDDRT